MGGNSKDTFSHIDLTKLTEAADARLKALAKTGTKILFVCELEDRRSLDSKLARSPTFVPEKYYVYDGGGQNEAFEKINEVSVIVAFTETAKHWPFLDAVADKALVSRKQGIHVGGIEGASIPSKITAYRWPSMSWDRLVAMFAD